MELTGKNFGELCSYFWVMTEDKCLLTGFIALAGTTITIVPSNIRAWYILGRLDRLAGTFQILCQNLDPLFKALRRVPPFLQ
mmetsp:Transcript_13305/g.31144  ORF Transcript_13305/g.31144 Transcript_13305/m.31144 type:complete len:82 (-) Transcript_13305:1848-2093(-)